MPGIVRYISRASQIGSLRLYAGFTTMYTRIKFKINGVHAGKHLRSHGIPMLDLSLTGKFSVGEHFQLNNGRHFNKIGRQQPCCFQVGKKGSLQIGNNVGISATAIVCQEGIEIQDNVRIGGNCVIYDTDFHDLDYRKRTAIPEDFTNVITKKVIIGKNAFIGAHSTILKGVTIGEGAVIGAGSLVTRNIPAFEIWGGNPVKFISSLA